MDRGSLSSPAAREPLPVLALLAAVEGGAVVRIYYYVMRTNNPSVPRCRTNPLFTVFRFTCKTALARMQQLLIHT